MSNFAFDESERVLCFHGPHLYEAKVLKRDTFVEKKGFEDGNYYFVHYKGWKSSWDEWVPETRALKLNEESLAKQLELLDATKSAKQKLGKGSDKKADQASDKNKKRRRDFMMERVRVELKAYQEQEEEYMKRPEVKILIPDALKLKLVEDWESVTKNQQLVSLPREPTVSQLLENFKTDFNKQQPRKSRDARSPDDVVNEVVEGLKAYFDKALGRLLLFRFEKQQYLDIKKESEEKPMSDVYGAEHLLRLFGTSRTARSLTHKVILPSLIAHTNMDQDAVNILKDHLALILNYIQKHQADLFLAEYDIATPAYIARLE